MSMSEDPILLAHRNSILLGNLVDELKRRQVRAEILVASSEALLIHTQCFHPARVVFVDAGFSHIDRIIQCLSADPLRPGLCVCCDAGQTPGAFARTDRCRCALDGEPVGVICDRLESMLAEGRPPETVAVACARRHEDIQRLLFLAGISPRTKGSRYLRLALEMIAEDSRLLENLEGRLYPALALRCGDTPANVERSMRYAVRILWPRMDPDVRLRLLPRCGERPGIKQLLAAFAERFVNAPFPPE